MLIISHKQLLQCFLVYFCRYFMKLHGFTSLNLRYCYHPLNLNHPNFNIAPYGKKNQKNELLEMTKCNGTKLLPHNCISLTCWTIFFTENIRYPFNIFPVFGIWGTKYLNNDSLRLMTLLYRKSLLTIAHSQRSYRVTSSEATLLAFSFYKSVPFKIHGYWNKSNWSQTNYIQISLWCSQGSGVDDIMGMYLAPGEGALHGKMWTWQ